MKFEAKTYVVGMIALCWASLAGSSIFAASTSGKENSVLFQYQGKDYHKSELSPALRQALYDAEKLRFDNISRIVENAVLDEYLDEQAKKSGKSRQQVEEVTFNVDLSEKEAKAWYDDNKARLGGRDFDSIKTEIIHFLKRQEQEKVRDQLVAKVKQEGKFSLTITEPQAPSFDIATAGFPSRGAAQPKVTIVEFADYQCPHCQVATSNLKKVVDQYKDQVKLVYLDFPLREDGASTTVAEGGVCAHAQNKFWDYHYLAFAGQASLNNNSPLEFAKQLKLDLDQFKKCLQADATKEKVERAKREGVRLGIQGTPAIYLNGQRIAGHSEEALVEEIKKLL